MKILWKLFLDHHKIGLYLGVISLHFRVFLKVKVQDVDIFRGCLYFKYFGVLEIPDIIGG